MSGRYCRPLKSQDKTAYNICERLRSDGISRAQLDTGRSRPDYFRSGDHRVEISDSYGMSLAGNFQIEATEAYEQAINVATEAFHSRGVSTFDPTAQTQDFLNFLSDKTDMTIPWLETNSIRTEQARQDLLAALQNPQQFVSPGLLPGTSDYNYQLAEGLYHFVNGHADISFNTDLDSYFFASLCHILGLKVQPVEDTIDNHVFMSLQLDPHDPSQSTFVDFRRGVQGFDVSRRSHEWVAITEAEVLAYHYTEQAAGLTDPAERAQALDWATRLAPDNYRVILAQGQQQLRNGDTAKACELFRQSISLNTIYAGATHMIIDHCQTAPVTKPEAPARP